MVFKQFINRIQTVVQTNITDNPLYEAIFHSSPNALCLTDHNGNIKYINQTFCNLTGYLQDELIGNNMSILKSLKNDASLFTQFWQELYNTSRYSGQIWNRHKDGNHYLHDINITKIISDTTYYLCTYHDATEAKQIEERYRYLAFHDPLTGLANRMLFEDRLDQAIKNAARTGTMLGVLFCDLNEFKQLNDEYGHLTGDNILKEIAKLLSTFFRTTDTIARLGGDEFVVVVEQLQNDHEIQEITNKLKKKLKEPLGEKRVYMSASIGTAIFPSEGTSRDQLLSIADHKMYDDKSRFYGLNQ